MTIVGGSSAAYYRCSLERKKGACSNKLSVREDVVRAYVLGRMRELLFSREIIGYMRESAARQLAELSKRVDRQLSQHRAELSRMEQRIQGLIELMADGERSDYVRRSLRELEVQAHEEKTAIAHIEAQSRASSVELPGVDESVSAALDLDRMLRTDIRTARAELRRLFKDGRIFLVPDDGAYTARSEIFPLAPFALSSRNRPKKEQRDFPKEIALFHEGSGGRI